MSIIRLKLKDKFEVSKFMTLLPIDFLYSEVNDRFLLLNQDMFGNIDRSIIDKQKEKSRIVVIDNERMVMEVYNIPEEEVSNAMMHM